MDELGLFEFNPYEGMSFTYEWGYLKQNNKDLSAHDGEIKTRNGVAQNEEYRHLGYGAHLHLEVFRTPEIDFETAFVKKDGINNSITIYAKTNPIVNPFNFEEKYTNGDNY